MSSSESHHCGGENGMNSLSQVPCVIPLKIEGNKFFLHHTEIMGKGEVMDPGKTSHALTDLFLKSAQ